MKKNGIIFALSSIGAAVLSVVSVFAQLQLNKCADNKEISK